MSYGYALRARIVERRALGLRVLAITAAAAAGGLAGVFLGAIVHEAAHVMIFRRYGCAWSLGLLTDGLWVGVYPDCPPATQPIAGRATLVAEAVGYHLVPAAGLIGALLGGRHGYRAEVAR